MQERGRNSLAMTASPNTTLSFTSKHQKRGGGILVQFLGEICMQTESVTEKQQRKLFQNRLTSETWRSEAIKPRILTMPYWEVKSPAGWAWLISAALVRKETGKQERRFSALLSWWYKQRQVEWSGRSRFREEYSFQRHSSSEFVKVSEQFTVQNYVQISTSPSIQFWGIQIKCSENYSSDKYI